MNELSIADTNLKDISIRTQKNGPQHNNARQKGTQHKSINGGEDLRISGPSYKRTLVYLLILEDLRIQ
jgi:hypothetical protein